MASNPRRNPKIIAFYKSQQWKKCRINYIKQCGGLCERCLAKGIYKPGYIVHHKVYLNSDNVGDPNVTLNHDNLEYLCLECHNKEHFKQKNIRYSVDEDGHVITPPYLQKKE